MLKIVETVGKAVGVYGSLAFKEMISNCMSQDLSWKVSPPLSPVHAFIMSSYIITIIVIMDGW